MSATRIYHLRIDRFRGIKDHSWHPGSGVNVILGGGDVGKTTILEAIGLLLHPTNQSALADTDYYGRDIEAGFSIEAVVSLVPSSGISYQSKHSWPWHWNGTEAVVPSNDDDAAAAGELVYRLRVRGAEHELFYEIVQPDSGTDILPVALRRSIGLVRLAGDDRNDRDLRLVQGSALDRLLSDKGLRARLASGLAKTGVKEELQDPGKELPPGPRDHRRPGILGYCADRAYGRPGTRGSTESTRGKAVGGEAVADNGRCATATIVYAAHWTVSADVSSWRHERRVRRR